MKYTMKQFKSLEICIKELEPFIRDGEHLQTGKPFRNFDGLRSREILANWLLCVVINFEEKSEQAILCSDPQGGDGIIYDKIKQKAWATEHVFVPRNNTNNNDGGIESLILKAITQKQNKGGAAYASGKTLIVFLNASGNNWYPNKVARDLPTPLDFSGVCVVGLQGVIDDEYVYNVTRLNETNSPMWQVHIKKDFQNWEVKRIQ